MNSVRLDTRCPYCGGASKPYLLAKDLRMRVVSGEFAYDRCGTCHAVFQNPMPSPEAIPSYYVGTYTPYETYNQPFIWNTGPLPPNGKILDVGCASGNTLAGFNKLYPEWEIFGFDFSDAALVKAAARLPKALFSSGDLIDLLSQTPENMFDVIICEHVVEHVIDPNHLVREISRVLRPGGLFLLAYPNASSLAARIFRSFYFNLEAPRHLALPSPASMEALTSLMPLKLVELRGQTYPTTLLGSIELATGKTGTSRFLQKLRIGSVISLLLKPFATSQRFSFVFSKLNAIYRKDLNNDR